MAVNRGRVHVQVYDSRIDSLFNRGGDVEKDARETKRLILVEAVKTAPKRRGDLAKEHKDGGWLRTGKLLGRGYVDNVSSYAAAVHEGTLGLRIVPTHSLAMPIPKVKGGPAKRHGAPSKFLFPVGPGVDKKGNGFPKKSVAGQRANPWLLRAADKVLSRR